MDIISEQKITKTSLSKGDTRGFLFQPSKPGDLANTSDSYIAAARKLAQSTITIEPNAEKQSGVQLSRPTELHPEDNSSVSTNDSLAPHRMQEKIELLSIVAIENIKKELLSQSDLFKKVSALDQNSGNLGTSEDIKNLIKNHHKKLYTKAKEMYCDLNNTKASCQLNSKIMEAANLFYQRDCLHQLEQSLEKVEVTTATKEEQEKSLADLQKTLATIKESDKRIIRELKRQATIAREAFDEAGKLELQLLLDPDMLQHPDPAKFPLDEKDIEKRAINKEKFARLEAKAQFYDEFLLEADLDKRKAMAANIDSGIKERRDKILGIIKEYEDKEHGLEKIREGVKAIQAELASRDKVDARILRYYFRMAVIFGIKDLLERCVTTIKYREQIIGRLVNQIVGASNR